MIGLASESFLRGVGCALQSIETAYIPGWSAFGPSTGGDCLGPNDHRILHDADRGFQKKKSPTGRSSVPMLRLNQIYINTLDAIVTEHGTRQRLSGRPTHDEASRSVRG